MPKPAGRHGVVIVVLAVYLVALALIAFWPVPVDSGARGTLWWVLGRLRDRGLGWIDYGLVESAANVILFVPYGFLLGVLGGPRRRLLMLAIAIGSSIAIEVGQAVLLPARFASIGDILANSLGAVVGALLALVFDRIARRRPPRSSPPDDPAEPDGSAGPA